jgi:hypothetical protein
MRQFQILLRPCACGAAQQSLDLENGAQIDEFQLNKPLS